MQKNYRKELAHNTLLPELYFQSKVFRFYQKAARVSAKQKAYLNERFQIGEKTGHKADSAQVAKDMRHGKHEDGNRRFNVDEFLTSQ